MTMAGLRHLWQHHRLSVIAFSIALAVTVFFVIRLTLATIYWSDPAHLKQPPERWMTPGYVARSWHLAPEAVAEALGLDEDMPPRRQTLEELAQARDVPIDALLADLTVFLNAQRP